MFSSVLVSYLSSIRCMKWIRADNLISFYLKIERTCRRNRKGRREVVRRLNNTMANPREEVVENNQYCVSNICLSLIKEFLEFDARLLKSTILRLSRKPFKWCNSYNLLACLIVFQSYTLLTSSKYLTLSSITMFLMI